MVALHRPIRSFVLRQGRISDAQRRAYETLMPRYGIPYAPRLLDAAASFGRSAPLVMEIGFGMGEATAQIAAAQPLQDHLAVEVHTPGVGGLLKLVEAQGLTNVRVIQHDAVEVLRDMIPPDSLAALHIFFPDPWPKKRHHKRRLLQAPFVAMLARRLKPGAYVHVATDWQDYAESILEVLSDDANLVNSAERYAQRPEHRPLTRFESRGLKLGYQVWDIVFERIQRAGDTSAFATAKRSVTDR